MGVNRYNGGIRNREGSYMIGFRRADYQDMIDVSLPHLKIKTKQIIACGAVGAILVCSGAVFALPYLAKLIK
jgi:hypothetical protein